MVGDRLTLTIGAVAHGGHCVARHEGQVVFVRHALPGEVVVTEITDIGPRGRYLRADVREVTTASPDRVSAPCRYAGVCGGCDWQHATLAAQRQLKATVVEEQLLRLGKVERSVIVEELAGDTDGLGWRSRVTFAVDDQGRAGLRRHRSHDVVPVEECVIAHPLVTAAGVTGRIWPGAEQVDVAASVSTRRTTVSVDGTPTKPLRESAAGRQWRVSGGGFWQVHPLAADTLIDTVLEHLAPALGEHAIDLYAGVGLFAGPLAERLGPGGRVDVVEANRLAAADATTNLTDLATVRIHETSVVRFLAKTPLRHCDLVVLDPPRAGAGREVLERVTRLGPRAISYVACDPAALGRDTAYLADLGYRLTDLRALDLFPMTHHVECVASFRPA